MVNLNFKIELRVFRAVFVVFTKFAYFPWKISFVTENLTIFIKQTNIWTKYPARDKVHGTSDVTTGGHKDQADPEAPN